MRSLILIAALAMTATAEEKPSEPPNPAPKITLKRVERSATDVSLSATEVLKNFTVPAGGNRRFNGVLDYTGAEHVSIGADCPTGQSMKNIQFVIWWGIPIADFLYAADVIFGSDLIFANIGAQVVPVHGSQIQVEIRNVGTADVTFNQVTTYAVVH